MGNLYTEADLHRTSGPSGTDISDGGPVKIACYEVDLYQDNRSEADIRNVASSTHGKSGRTRVSTLMRSEPRLPYCLIVVTQLKIK